MLWVMPGVACDSTSTAPVGHDAGARRGLGEHAREAGCLVLEGGLLLVDEPLALGLGLPVDRRDLVVL
jgi:hypothetical protein